METNGIYDDVYNTIYSTSPQTDVHPSAAYYCLGLTTPLPNILAQVHANTAQGPILLLCKSQHTVRRKPISYILTVFIFIRKIGDIILVIPQDNNTVQQFYMKKSIYFLLAS